LYLSKLHPIPQRPHLRPNPNLHRIPRLQKLRLGLHRIPDARTRPRHNKRPLLQRRPLTHIRHKRRNLEAQIINSLALSHLTIDLGLQMQLTRIRYEFRRHDLRTNRCVRVEAFAEIPLGDCTREKRVALEFARRDVVAGEVAADVRVGVGFRHVFRVTRDDEAEFAFVVGLVVLGDFGDDNGRVVARKRGVGFYESGRVGWEGAAAFLDCT
jgi:hypothetical protein